jgi:hypothetical protein
MPISEFIRTCIAVLMTLAALYGLILMFQAESDTAYAQWAFAAGLVFLGVGAALMFYDKDDTVKTRFNGQSGRK